MEGLSGKNSSLFRNTQSSSVSLLYFVIWNQGSGLDELWPPLLLLSQTSLIIIIIIFWLHPNSEKN